ncbi:hypothetical protein CCACVL1_30026 [Corchorus capsularis]|uniref:DDE Tnp4 domain-containing protein n=1 Tax=Corchorus capsularis TaxID=210143 RepID=A0A1R3FZ21_COCAP|nr:hypothetical protein CCACVL1_30026 [Corchorus capsularis]
MESREYENDNDDITSDEELIVRRKIGGIFYSLIAAAAGIYINYYSKYLLKDDIRTSKLSGWSSSARHACFLKALEDFKDTFPHPLEGKYFVVDAGYPNMKGNVIEQSFGVWKNRWRILLNIPSYPLTKQVKLVAATMSLHNYIRKHAIKDEEFDRCNQDPNYMPCVEGESHDSTRDKGAQAQAPFAFNNASADNIMSITRDQIAESLMSGR